MSALSEKFGDVEGTPIVSGEDNGSFRNSGNASDDDDDDKFNISFVQIGRKFCKSLDINQPPQTEVNDRSCFSMGLNNETEPQCFTKETKKSNKEGTKVIEHAMFGVDMEKKVALSVKYLPSYISISSSSSSSKETCISDENLDINSEIELPSLVLMGCTHCHIYVMVAETEPKCPKCNSSVLLDVFRGNAAKI